MIKHANLLSTAVLLWMFLLSLSTGCVEVVLDGSAPCSDDDDCTDGRCVDGRCVGDRTQDASDSAIRDAGARDIETEPPPNSDADSNPADSATPDIGRDDIDDVEDSQGDFGDSCDESSDCASGVCIDLGSGQICSQLCGDGCPEGYTCGQLDSSMADDELVCLPKGDLLCAPCEDDSDCGGPLNHCIARTDGSFCAADCDLDGWCPDHFVCSVRTITDVGGGDVEVRLCEPESGVCSDCFDQDDDDYGVGFACLGVDCDDEDPDVHPGATELCNGIDDNCRDDIDEGFDLENDPNVCGDCTPCDLPNVDTHSCVEGQCLATTCDGGWGDCNTSAAADGCETVLDAVTSCGSSCADIIDCSALPNVDVVSCAEGACQIDHCDDGWADCSGGSADGCETNLNGLATCGTACDGLIDCGALSQVDVATCIDGVCGITNCDTGWDDCTGGVSDGCETFIYDTVRCGSSCATTVDCTALPQVDGVSCNDGACSIASCDDDWGDCLGGSADGCETNLAVTTSCGSTCANAVNCTTLPGVSAVTCSNDVCGITSCSSGYAECDDSVSNGCERNLDDDFGSCSSTSYLGAVSGDTGEDTLSFSSFGEFWFELDVTENYDSELYISALLHLDVPPGVDYDLYAHCEGSCGGGGPYGFAGTGLDEWVELRWEDVLGPTNSRTVWIEVRFFGGSTLDCGGWTLNVYGNVEVLTTSCF